MSLSLLFTSLLVYDTSLLAIHCYLCLRYIATCVRYIATCVTSLLVYDTSLLVYWFAEKCSTQSTFGAPISWALPNAKPSALNEMIFRINEFIKSVSTLFYHLRATSLCFGDAHCSVTSDKSNISTRFLCDSMVYRFSSSLTDYRRQSRILEIDRQTNF